MRTFLGLLAIVLALGAVGSAIWAFRPAPAGEYDMLGLETLAPQDLAGESYRFLPIMLQQVYSAFGETEEAAIYDGLALVASGPALEQLYLERVGAMAGGGLEPDQEIHEIALLGLSATTGDGNTVTIDADWRVLGVVGHAEHMHMRGNAYAADLVLRPVDGAWKLTGFTLTDVDRTGAGTLEISEDTGSAANRPGDEG